MESFWSSLKRELVHRVRFATRAEARAAVFEWIEIFYNRERLHSALGYKPPVDFETQLERPRLNALTRHLSTKSGQGHI
jgi:putative transposase